MYENSPITPLSAVWHSGLQLLEPVEDHLDSRALRLARGRLIQRRHHNEFASVRCDVVVPVVGKDEKIADGQGGLAAECRHGFGGDGNRVQLGTLVVTRFNR